MDTPEKPQVRQFSNFISELRNGAVNEELGLALASVVKEVEKSGKAGALDLKIKIIPNKGEGTVFVQAIVTDKPPKFDPPSNIFYIDREFNLRREDPRQMNFTDLKPGGAKEETPTTK